jgi:hypothetical protein
MLDACLEVSHFQAPKNSRFPNEIIHDIDLMRRIDLDKIFAIERFLKSVYY